MTYTKPTISKGTRYIFSKINFYLFDNQLFTQIYSGVAGPYSSTYMGKIGCFLVYYGSSRYNIQQIFSK